MDYFLVILRLNFNVEQWLATQKYNILMPVGNLLRNNLIVKLFHFFFGNDANFHFLWIWEEKWLQAATKKRLIMEYFPKKNLHNKRKASPNIKNIFYWCILLWPSIMKKTYATITSRTMKKSSEEEEKKLPRPINFCKSTRWVHCGLETTASFSRKMPHAGSSFPNFFIVIVHNQCTAPLHTTILSVCSSREVPSMRKHTIDGLLVRI